MIDPVSAASTAINVMKLVRLVELMLDVVDETNIAIDDVVEMRAQAKREGRDHLSEAEMEVLTNKVQAAIDEI